MKTNRYIYLSLLELFVLLITLPLIIYLIYLSFITNDFYKFIIDLLDITIRIILPSIMIIFIFLLLQYNNNFNYNQFKQCCDEI
ncbi:hypothetical protein Hokovirus_3_219 [Hokovirus HKV1]|uniref:Uncharacterized protein n=1 Tax=Hokovirus HKV1 TaxID=1977638 RepID=A0A1V0SGU3_9VIRU|nr:hypothetical protein Hokovirus_3_219 [Hokovirus HKV1]